MKSGLPSVAAWIPISCTGVMGVSPIAATIFSTSRSESLPSAMR